MDKLQFKKVGALIGVLFVITALLSYKSSLPIPLAVMVVLAPIYEELIFRRWILKRWGVVISCILFGLWHLKNLFYFELNDVLYQMAWAGLIIGPVLGYLALRWKTIWPGVIVHYLNNIGSLVLAIISLDWRSVF